MKLQLFMTVSHKVIVLYFLLDFNCFFLYYLDDNGMEHQVSYQELEIMTNKIARTLRNFCKPRDNGDSIVAVSMKPSHYLPITLLSILKSGMAYLPLDVEFPESRVKHILVESEPLIVIIDGGKLYGTNNK